MRGWLRCCRGGSPPRTLSVADVLLPARFLSMLEEEIYGENSPIWEADFTVPAAEGAQMVSRPGIGEQPSQLRGCRTQG